jgi:hypothetical protein
LKRSTDPADVAGEPKPTPQAISTTAEQLPAWEMIETGRYMPRRIRGSFPGRELG